jgi:hypothetical protein
MGRASVGAGHGRTLNEAAQGVRPNFAALRALIEAR